MICHRVKPSSHERTEQKIVPIVEYQCHKEKQTRNYKERNFSSKIRQEFTSLRNGENVLDQVERWHGWIAEEKGTESRDVSSKEYIQGALHKISKKSRKCVSSWNVIFFMLLH